MRIKQVFLGRRGLYRVAYRSFSNLGLNLGALRTRERRESGNASVPAGGCPAFVSSFPSGGEDMVRSRFRTDLGGGGLGRPGGKRADSEMQEPRLRATLARALILEGNICLH